VGPPRHECDFALMFRSDWTPDHLQSGPTNLYKEIALALKGAEWRTPGLVALARKIADGASRAEGATTKKGRQKQTPNPTLKVGAAQALPPAGAAGTLDA
jgi:hypothetical protein